MIKLLKYFKVIDWIMSFAVIGVVVGQVWLEMRLIKLMGNIISMIQTYAQGIGVLNEQMLWEVGGEMLLVAGGIFACAVLVNFLASNVAARFSKAVRLAVFKKVNNFSMEEMNKFSTASLITRSTNDIRQVEQTIFMTLRMAVTAPVMGAFAVKEIIGSSLELTWTTVGALGIMLALVLLMVFVAVPRFGKIQKKTDKLNAVTRENLTGLRVVRAYNAESQQEKKFDDVNSDLTKTTLFVNRVTAIISPGMSLVMNGLGLVIYWFGAYLINMGSLEYYNLVTFSQYAMHVLMSFMFVAMLFVFIPRGIICARRVRDVLDTETKIHDGNNVQPKTQTGTIEFKNVSFAYPDAEVRVLEDISFVANKGETVAFIGSTGSGKSTLVNLIPRFFDATEGEILIDGKNIKDYKLEELNNLLGFVPQKGYLFSGTIKSNLEFGKKDATEEEMLNALDIAQAGFVKKLDGGLDYEIAQGGSNVSG
ncbi:MAG: ABC transporter ATP-binding protein, partial [Clostridia bacterium]|nr:ABC transporter ATP-binding protein [Clostridia bacterium]